MSTRAKEPSVFPVKGDRVAHGQYGPGTVTELDIYHTVIDFDGHGLRRFVTNRVVLEPTLDPGPSATERRAAEMRRAREERKRKREVAKEVAAAPVVAPTRRGSTVKRTAGVVSMAAVQLAEAADD
jgi:hypothetical protein